MVHQTEQQPEAAQLLEKAILLGEPRYSTMASLELGRIQATGSKHFKRSPIEAERNLLRVYNAPDRELYMEERSRILLRLLSYQAYEHPQAREYWKAEPKDEYARDLRTKCLAMLNRPQVEKVEPPQQRPVRKPPTLTALAPPALVPI